MTTDVPAGSDIAQTASEDGALHALIRRDQLVGVQRSLAIALPVNALLSVATLLVAIQFGQAHAGSVWFLFATVVNLARFLQMRLRLPGGRSGSDRAVRRQLHWASILAFLSGSVWACTPFLATQAGGPDAVFHLIVGAGITGGSIALAFAFAPVAIGFVAPILASHAVTLLFASGPTDLFLAATIGIYLIALCRSAVRGGEIFCETTRLRHEATTLARSLQQAHARTSAVAEEMSHHAQHDSLTGLLNRAGFLMALQRRAAETPAPGACGLMLLDLDGFKSINDTFGHQVGDRVLVEVARRTRPILPDEAVIARLGGDEFAIAFDPTRSPLRAEALAERLIAAIGGRFVSFDAGRLGVSIGIYEGDWPNVADVLVYADEALYAAKSEGRNRHRVFDARLRQRLEMRRDSERDLMTALQNSALQLWYQPIFADGGRRLAGVEGLLRWSHPRHGPVPPGVIVAAAAMSGHADRLLGFIVDEACAMARRFRSLGRGDITVSINVSPREMSQLPVDRIVLDRVTAAGLPASALEIEITEETALDIRAVEGKLAVLSDAGIRIAIDDFGVGYSSLANLRQMRVGRIKIDRCFVSGLASSPDNRMLLQAVVSLGRSLQLDVVAEGVETAHDVVILRALGCQHMQGYHLGKPMQAHEVLALVVGLPARGAATAA